MKRILCFIDSLGSGGAQRQLVGLANELCSRGYDVTLCVYTDNPFYLPELNKNKIKYEYIAKAHSKYFRIYYIYKYVKKLSPDCIISYLEVPSIIMSIIKIFSKRFKLIVSERNTTQKIRLKDKLRFYLYNNADYIVSNSYTQNNFIKTNFPKIEYKCLPIVNFVDTSKFVKLYYKKTAFVTFIVAASITKSKNTMNFIKSLQQVLHKGYNNFIVKWFGVTNKSNPYYLSCEEYVEKNNLHSIIQFFPKTLNIKEEYANASFFCLPSLYEGTPNALCEALSCGLPSICSNVSDNSYYVQDNYNGFLFDPYSVDSMANGIINCLLMTNEVYEKFSDRSRKIIEENLNIKKFVESYIKIIEAPNL